MRILRRYGDPPYSVAVVHGGPGARGEMEPVAKELSRNWSVLEPLQTATSVDAQLQELRVCLQGHGEHPLTIVGHSWGAWLGFIYAARHPLSVRKLVLIGSAPFEEEYAAQVARIRLNRLDEEERLEFTALMDALNRDGAEDESAVISRLRAMLRKTDTFDSLQTDVEEVECRCDILRNVWSEARELRKSGALLELGSRIRCPVVAIHGDYDPHPYMGVEKPLSGVVKEFKFIVVKNCGHTPWLEKQMRDAFYGILEDELR